MPKTRARTFFGAGDYGREAFTNVLNSLEDEGKITAAMRKKLTFKNFCKFMEEDFQQEAQTRAQNEATDILFEGFADMVGDFYNEVTSEKETEGDD